LTNYEEKETAKRTRLVANLQLLNI